MDYLNASSHIVKSVPSEAAVQQLLHELPSALTCLLLSTTILYAAIYLLLKRRFAPHAVLTFFSIGLFAATPYVAPLDCIAAPCIYSFAIEIGILKALDLFARRTNLPRYRYSPQPLDAVMGLLLLTELRYESFTPNQIRHSAHEQSFSERHQYLIHIAISPVIAFEILLAIYVIWTSIQLLLRYKSSPVLFGPLYHGNSLASLWTETWHNAFAAPCMSLAFNPVRNTLRSLDVPHTIAKGAGILAVFVLMGFYHVYALLPLLSAEGLRRILVFFAGNGLLTVLEFAAAMA
ncbi:hypothetical protein H2199_002595 [Coniosporium tulheliwenetii]|uniref:Uncharacterized protein n=1 Tax=Coniosporium tulheliwenetii TaxID=3383036 RepID=A0ACC2ZFI4_9PEZI|nr:hypothetical protein H2199_002595 [Cladosporium sp. JES 115]